MQTFSTEKTRAWDEDRFASALFVWQGGTKVLLILKRKLKIGESLYLCIKIDATSGQFGSKNSKATKLTHEKSMEQKPSSKSLCNICLFKKLEKEFCIPV